MPGSYDSLASIIQISTQSAANMATSGLCSDGCTALHRSTATHFPVMRLYPAAHWNHHQPRKQTGPLSRKTTCKKKPPIGEPIGGFRIKPGSDLLSHGETPHYHRRYTVSLLSSGWDQVVPVLYCRQTNLWFNVETLNKHSV